MKKILVLSIVLLFTILFSVSIIGTPKAQAFDIEIPDICELIPALCNPSITPPVDEVTPTAEVTPDVTISEDPTVTPEETITVTPVLTNPPSDNNGGKHEDKSDGRSDGRSDGLGCASHPCIPNAPPKTGRGL